MYLNLIEIAESFGVAEKVVEDWIRDQGLPHTLDRGRLLFDRAQVAHWAASHGLTARAGFLAPDRAAFDSAIHLAPMLRLGGIRRDVDATAALATLERVVESLVVIPGPVRHLLNQRLRSPGGLNWAPVGAGFALPHFGTRVILGRGAGVVALILARSSFSLPAPPVDDEPVRRLLFFIPPSPRAHLEMLGRLSRAIGWPAIRGPLERSAADGEILAAFEALDQSDAIARDRAATP